MEQTLLLLKPDIADKQDEVIYQLKQNGFKIAQVLMS